ncbi:PREDICTED: uncharacterized protein LOC106339208 [Brassica oleracea var. oleracea]|uniref:uncharacterized protein LOC106339208 n=1 Tax=Brassica oleracea var. oleracea TaxID=109376 RepID=UPI0006A70308|nr:PREDICTED: uncharacterized protein LOC106339208 [Brassica oleracea var. oleracea]
MSLDEEEPLTLPDDPKFRVFDKNETSLLGRLLNPDCQSMERMIEYMPTAWRVYGRVRGIALSRDRFQFVFQREEDLQTVLKDRPWSYNHWAMVLERWTANPPEDFLQSMMIWIRIRHIPVNFFTSETMYKLASEVGMVEEIAYDPKISHTKDYIRALVIFNTNNPAKASRKLTVEGGTVSIEFEYEKIHKRCFHCLCLTHEKMRCPLLKRGVYKAPKSSDVPRVNQGGPIINEPPASPPGFPLMFPEQSAADRKMAMLYISHSDPTERLARIERVKQGISENMAASSVHLTRITKEFDKGKGHVFSYTELLESQQCGNSSQGVAPLQIRDKSDEDTESSASKFSTRSAPIVPSGFQLGPSLEGRVTGNLGANKAQRRRPPSWKRRAASGSLKSPVSTSTPQNTELAQSSKQKAGFLTVSSENKNQKMDEFHAKFLK